MEKPRPVSAAQQGAEALKDIRFLMERSSRFISLSGWSGVAAGVSALLGAGLFVQTTGCWKVADCLFSQLAGEEKSSTLLKLFGIGAGTLLLALFSALFFTWMKSRKSGQNLYGRPARRMLWSVGMPIVAGGIFIYNMIKLEQFDLVAPACLIFYGLALVNGSRYTLSEIRYLGYGNIILGLVNCYFIGYGLLFWSLGFGVLHIVYGIIMWWKYDSETALKKLK